MVMFYIDRYQAGKSRNDFAARREGIPIPNRECFIGAPMRALARCRSPVAHDARTGRHSLIQLIHVAHDHVALADDADHFAFFRHQCPSDAKPYQEREVERVIEESRQ